MKSFKDIGLIFIIVIVIVAGGVGFYSRRFLGNDNSVEEISEEIIKEATGVDIDLSPGIDPDLQHEEVEEESPDVEE